MDRLSGIEQTFARVVHGMTPCTAPGSIPNADIVINDAIDRG
jgi:hypothetical protein